MTGIAASHTTPQNIDRIRVSLALQLSATKSVTFWELYKLKIEEACGDVNATIKFFGQGPKICGATSLLIFVQGQLVCHAR